MARKKKQDLETEMLEQQELQESRSMEESIPEPEPLKKALTKFQRPEKIEPKAILPMVLLILQILGAIPAVISAAKKLWDLISQIKDQRIRADAKFSFRKMVYGRKDLMRKQKKSLMSTEDNSQIMSEIDTMTEQINSVLKSQGG